MTNKDFTERQIEIMEAATLRIDQFGIQELTIKNLAADLIQEKRFQTVGPAVAPTETIKVVCNRGKNNSSELPFVKFF